MTTSKRWDVNGIHRPIAQYPMGWATREKNHLSGQ
jgi:hypothetical protein